MFELVSGHTSNYSLIVADITVHILTQRTENSQSIIHTKEKHKGRYTIIESKNYGTHGSDIPQKKKSYENNDWVIFLP